MSADIRVVVFDLGRVMIRLAAGWDNACQAAGVPYRGVPETDAFAAALESLELDYGRGLLDSPEYYARLYTLAEGRYSLDELQALHMAVIQPEYPGIANLVRAIQATGLRTACLSNTCAAHWTALVDPARYPAIGLLDARHASHLLGLMKPDPAIYRRFEALIGATPAEILFFDDGPKNVGTARLLGWHAELITDPDDSLPLLREALARYGVLPAIAATH